MEKFTFFWRTASPFSQWFPANFTVDGVHYTSAEQYMMHQKALLFGDQNAKRQNHEDPFGFGTEEAGQAGRWVRPNGMGGRVPAHCL